MARNSLAHGQQWETRCGMVVTLGTPIYGSYKEDHPQYGEREWFGADNGLVYCNVDRYGKNAYGEMETGADLIRQVA